MRLKKQIPNALSLSRLIIAIFVFYAIYRQNFGQALSLFLLALLTDAFDGYLARRWKAVTFIGGEIFETLGDGFLILLSILAFVIIGALPLWFFLSLCLGALIFLTYTRQSKNELVKDITIVVQYLGYSTFITCLALYLSHYFSSLITLLVLIFLAMAVYLKRGRFFFVLEHGQHLFHKENRI